MTAKEKAEELIEKMNDVAGGGIYDAKQYALIAIDEIINSIENEHVSEIFENYWEKVKQEIENL